ncbi:hypothetical protein LCGC14_1268250 [marine sediment metagenome]|uniref:PhoU domain-containing protein n=1 Tax=marine sediment metagenome TaxID=412755 RepID=A0A0F9P207_9ZZZZ
MIILISVKDDKINRKIHLVKNILTDVYEILEIFKPLLDKMLKMKEADRYIKNGNIERAASLFGDISFLCKEIENDSPLNISLDNLGN